MKLRFYSLPILIFFICSSVYGQNWSAMPQFPGSRAESRFGGISVSVGNKAFVGLGLSLPANGDFKFFKDFWHYDVVTKVWTRLADFPGVARYDAVAFVIGSNIYVGTGDIAVKSAELNSGIYKKDFYSYNTLTGVWIQIPDFPENRGEAVAFTLNGKGYVSCGRNGDGAKSDLYSFDPATSSWTRRADLPSSARSYPIGFSINGKGYVGGGYTGGWIFVGDGSTPAFFNDFWQYDPSLNQWINKGTTYNGLSSGGHISEAVTVSSCEKAYVIGGRYSSDYTSPDCCSSVVSEYNPISNSWVQKANFPEIIYQGSGWLINGNLYAGLGTADFYTLPSYDVTGPSPICTSGTFTLANPPAGTTVTWSSSNPSGLSINPTTGLATRQNNFNGQVTITATLNGACGATNFTKNVKVGNYVPIGTSSYNSNCSGNNFNVLNTNLSAACTANTSIYFSYKITDPNYSNFVYTPVSVPSGATWSFSGGTLNMTVTTPPSQGSRSATIALSATGPCGPYNVNFTSTAVNYSSFFSMSPNPSQGNVTVSVDNENLLNDGSQDLIYAIKITDPLGMHGESFEYKAGINSINIPLQDFKPGLYILSVFDGKIWSSKQLIVQK